MELMALDGKLTVENIFQNYFGGQWPEPYDEAIKAVIWFYMCGKSKEQSEDDEFAQKLKKKRRSYDFDIDAESIYTSFQQAYKIDLQKINLHWWEFRILLIDLPEETPFMRRVYYRTAKTTGMSAKQKKEFDKLRKKYEIPERGEIDQKLSLLERDEAMKKYVEKRLNECK